MALADRRRDWFRFTRVFDRAARAFGATLPAGVLTALLLIVLPELALYWLGDKVASGLSFTDMLRSSFNVGSGGLGLITLVAGTLGHAGIVHVALLQFHREPVGAGQGLLSSFRFALPAIGIGILTWLGVVLGLILPGLTGIQTRLVPLAAAGLATVMVLAIGFHITRGELVQLPVEAAHKLQQPRAHVRF